jgi:hypothetical protein
MDFYYGGGASYLDLDKGILTLDWLTSEERRELLSFLYSLNGDLPTH